MASTWQPGSYSKVHYKMQYLAFPQYTIYHTMGSGRKGDEIVVLWLQNVFGHGLRTDGRIHAWIEGRA